MLFHTNQFYDDKGLVSEETVPYSLEDYINKIKILEEQITRRRLRDAVLYEDGRMWLEAKENEIDQIRQYINEL